MATSAPAGEWIPAFAGMTNKCKNQITCFSTGHKALAILACAALLALAVQPALAKTKAAPPNALKPLTVELPTNDDIFPDRPGAESLDRNCLGCHSVETVMNQPALPSAVWQAEIDKMRTAYKADIDPQDIDAIVTYLTGINGIARSKWR